MKKSLSSRRGSALLIVLGILSFMVVSAVAFSVLMRQSRLPSSFMRQKITSAYLVKAGLANAMSEIDQAIGDNPYPGVGTSGDKNNWERRVLMLDGSSSEGAVSTLPLEGLAYIPPPLINTVRYEMKRSPTAVWKTLGYDAGRYAYTAINVSDYMDVNRLRANVMRDSSPSNRISIAYLFENDQHTGDGTVSASAFDDFVRKASAKFNTRLVSMADYALAIGSGQAGFTSPFYDYVTSPTEDGVMYGDDAQIENIRRQKFVTDSWYPVSLTNQTATFELTKDDGQPFGRLDWKPALTEGFASLCAGSTYIGKPFFDRIMNNLNFPERVALKDYLDPDNVPTSLALPTLEHAPMLTGIWISPQAATFKPQVEEMEPLQDTQKTAKPGGGTVVTKTTRRLWKLKGFKGDDSPTIIARVSAVFPFKRSSLVKADGSLPTFTAHVFVKAYLLPDGQETDETRLTADLVRPTKTEEWKSLNQLGLAQTPCLTFYGSTGLTVNDSLVSESSGDADCQAALIDSDMVELTMSMSADLACPLYGVKITETEGEEEKSVEYDDSRFGELAGGKAIQYVEKVENIGRAESKTIAPNKELSLRWQFFAWVRITGDGGKTVDMFPASFKDDLTYNEIKQGEMATSDPDMLGQPLKDGVAPIVGPLAMKFDQSTFIDATTYEPVPIDKINLGFGADDKAQTLAIYCGDPRYNWAPEDWFAPGGDTISPGDWLSAVKDRLTGSECRPNADDIFQFVSNRGYLQSMGELQFLPLVRTGWTSSEVDLTGCTFCDYGRYTGGKFSDRKSVGDLVNNRFGWKSYSLFPTRGGCDSKSAFNPYNWGVVDAKDGATVCPYAEEELLMAALANTPYDYIVTSLAKAKPGNANLTLENGGRKYCFSAFSNEAKVEWTTLKEIAKQLKGKMEKGEDWWSMSAWNSETGNELFGQTLGCTIHDVDRKFLASYWKSCFANRQQLFLVFVRAEPTVMGAASSGHTPAQLGARAVALVWREPVSSVSDSGEGSSSGSSASSSHPHRMRILFYHQFGQ